MVKLNAVFIRRKGLRVADASWRWSFIITGAIGFAWVALWAVVVSTPEKTRWLPEAERQRIFAERDAGVEPPSHGGVGYLGLIRCPAMWGLFVSQGCLVYSVYLSLNPAAKAGLKKFINTGCVACHNGVGVGGGMYQKFGVVEDYWKATGSDPIDKGRFDEPMTL